MPHLRANVGRISIHTPRVGSDSRTFIHIVFISGISIHTPRVGSDDRAGSADSSHRAISIHTPRVGSDILLSIMLTGYRLFQSTLPVWGVTAEQGITARSKSNFNPHSPCGE